MKTERRHELQKNVLADSLGHWITAIEPYSRAILAAVIGLVVLAFAWLYLSNQNARRTAQGWTDFFDVTTASADPREGLNDVVQRYSGTVVAEWARLALADIQLVDGTNQLFANRANGRQILQQAAQEYQAVALDANEPTLRQRATYGAARAHEALGELDKARAEYRSLADKWPDSPLAKPAEERLKDLEQASTKSFYDWLARYEPPRPMANEPGTPGQKPDFMKDPLEGSNNRLPSLTDDGPILSTTPATEPEGEQPPEEPAAESAPPAEQPAAEQPAEQPTPPAEAPAADEAPAEQPAAAAEGGPSLE